MPDNITYERIILHFKIPFTLSYGTTETRTVYWLRINGDEGWGEGTIPPYYGVDTAAMETHWQAVAAANRPLPETVDEIAAWVGTQGPAPARSALELALYDRLGKKAGLPLWKLLNLPKPEPLPTSYTIAVDTPEAMANLALDLEDMPVLKIKLAGDDLDIARVAAIREARPDAAIRIDANAGWSLEQGIQAARAFEAYDLEMIEQPLARDAFEDMGKVQAVTTIPVVADESVQSLADVEKLAAAGVQGINLKLMKVGGLTNGLMILRRARELGMKVLLGSMIETSIGVTAMSHLMGMADWLDLDAPILVTDDPFDGLQYDADMYVHVPNRPGIGVRLRQS